MQSTTKLHWCSNHMLENIKTAGKAQDIMSHDTSWIAKCNSPFTHTYFSKGMLDAQAVIPSSCWTPSFVCKGLGHDGDTYKPFTTRTSPGNAPSMHMQKESLHLPTKIVSEILQSKSELWHWTTNLFSPSYTDAFHFLVTTTAHPFRKEPLTGSTKSWVLGMPNSHLRQNLQTTGCNWSCGVEGPKKPFLQKLSRDPQGPFTPCLPNRNTLPHAGERMLTAF